MNKTSSEPAVSPHLVSIMQSCVHPQKTLTAMVTLLRALWTWLGLEGEFADQACGVCTGGVNQCLQVMS